MDGRNGFRILAWIALAIAVAVFVIAMANTVLVRGV